MFRPVPGGQTAKSAPAEKRDRETRVVCGPELEKAMKTRIELDVYRFKGE